MVKVPLYQSLAKHVSASHCEAIDEYAIVLRVDGSLDQFGAEGISRLRFAKSARSITVDVQIPGAIWKPLSQSNLMKYISQQVRLALQSCVARLRRDGYAVEECDLFAEVDSAINDYLHPGRAG